MRIGRSLGVLVCAAGTVLAVGCGTQRAPAATSQPGGLAAAVSNTRDQTARIAATISTTTQGETMSLTEHGVFDFAHSRGMITMQSPVDMTEIFLPPTTYIKPPAADDGSGSVLPKGKTWLALPEAAASASDLLLLTGGSGDPADLLASLTAMSSSVTKLGRSTVRGVPVTGYALKIDPAKAAAKIPGADPAGVEALLKSLSPGAIPVEVWVDSRNLVRQERLTMTDPGGTGDPGGPKIVFTTDFYDFGVQVRVSAPPSSQVARESQLLAGASAAASGTGSGR